MTRTGWRKPSSRRPRRRLRARGHRKGRRWPARALQERREHEIRRTEIVTWLCGWRMNPSLGRSMLSWAGQSRLPARSAAWRVAAAACFEEEPDAALGLVDPDLEQARR